MYGFLGIFTMTEILSLKGIAVSYPFTYNAQVAQHPVLCWTVHCHTANNLPKWQRIFNTKQSRKDQETWNNGKK